MNSALRDAIRAEIQFRAQRGRTIPPELLGEPAWDILLDLAISYLNGGRLQTTAAGLTAGLPPTTALRWITQLAESGLVERVPDGQDRRRTWLELTRQAMGRIAACFGYEWEQEIETAVTEAGTSPADRPIFFPVQSATARSRNTPADERATAKALLLAAASDWFDQTYAERLKLAAQTLYTHGYLNPHEYRRIDLELHKDTEAMRAAKIDARRRAGVV